MPRKSTHAVRQDNSFLCLQYLRFCGGSARLSSISYSMSVIQTLLNRGLVKINNTGTGIFVEVVEV